MPAPFAPEVAQLITQTHEQTFSAVAYPPTGDPVVLDVTDYTVDWDENRIPRTTATIECAVPDQDTLDRLDPRTGTRVKLTAGYRLVAGDVDEHQVADLHLRVRRVRRPDNTMTLTLASDEFRLIDAAAQGAVTDDVITWTNGAIDFVHSTTNFLMYPVVPAFVVDPAVTDIQPIDVPSIPKDYWDAITDVLDALDVDLYDNGDRVFRLTGRRYIAAASTLTLSVGENGTILTSDAGLDLDDWANEVNLAYTWVSSVGTNDGYRTSRRVLSGPFAQDSGAPRNAKLFNRTGPVDPAVAQAAAATLLRRYLARARTYTIEAVAAWWVRPGDTVTLQLPTGNQERHLVASAEIRKGGAMRLVTRLPDTATPIGE